MEDKDESKMRQYTGYSYISGKYMREYALGKVQRNHIWLKLSGIHQLLVYSDDENLLGVKVNIIKEVTEILFETGKKVGVEVSTGKTMYILLSGDQNAKMMT